MKIIKSSYLSLAMGFLFFAACKDEETSPYFEPETAVHGWGRVADGSPADFVFQGDDALTVAFQWNSIEGANTATRIEFYAFFDEAYVDDEGNDRTAQHGGDYFDYTSQRGILFKTVEGSEIPANRADINFTVSQNDIYQLYKDASFDYGNGNGSVKVFENPAKPDRSPTAPFVAGDKFRLGWIIYTADDRKFDSWSPSICAAEFPNSSCYVEWAVICVSDLAGELDYVHSSFIEGTGGGAGNAIAGEVTGTVTWAPAKDAAGNVLAGKYTTTDASFGLFPFLGYQAEGIGGNPEAEDLLILDACNVITFAGTGGYGDTYSYSFLAINGATATIKWQNSYGDGGTLDLTRKDGRDWPALKGG